MVSKAPVIQPFPGCCIAETSAGSIQFGSPSDIIKLLQIKKIDIPSIIVLPDDFFAFGINQASIEFPLYYFLFVQQALVNNQKFTIVGTPSQIKRVKQILYLTLLGPTDKQLKQWKIKNAKQIRKELNFLALRKPGASRSANLEDIIQDIPFRNGTATINSVSIRKTGHNTFSLKDHSQKVMTIDISLKEKQPPPLPIKPPDRRVVGGILAMRALNTLSGFDPHGYTTGFIMWVNGVMISIDGVSWMEDHLFIHGLSHEKLKTYILTHIHDDHSSIIDQIVSSKKVTIITARIVFESFIHKLSAILDWKVSNVKKLVNFIDAAPGESQKILGADFEFWYTLHSIPTIGFKVSIRDRSFIFTGDMAYGKKLEEAFKKKIISKEKYMHQQNIPYQNDVTKIFLDGGSGEIHPDPRKMKRLGKNVVFFHTRETDSYLHSLTIAKAGNSWTAIPGRQFFVDDFTTFSNSPLFKEASLEWQRILLNSSTTTNYNEGDFVIKEGEKGGEFYLILAGTFKVISNDKVIAHLQQGDFFGEAALIFNKLRNISIKVATPGATIKFPSDLFFQYATESGIDQTLKKIKMTKPLILKLSLFHRLTPGMTNWISEIAEEKVFKKGEIIIKEGDKATNFFVIRSGKVQVDKRFRRKNVKIAILNKGQFVGEMGILGPISQTSATVSALTDVKMLSFKKEYLEQIIDSNPFLHLTIGKVMDARLESNKKTGMFAKRSGT